MIIKLFYKGDRFFDPETRNLSSVDRTLAILELDIDKEIALLKFTPNTSLVEKRTAERLASSICKSGFLLKDNRRIGMNYDLEISEIIADSEQDSAEKRSKPILKPVIPGQPASEIENANVPVLSENEAVVPSMVTEEQPERKISEQYVLQESYDEIANYFWVKLYGKIISTWNDLPEELKTNIFPKIAITNISDIDLKELFTIRGYNDKVSFIDKLKTLNT